MPRKWGSHGWIAEKNLAGMRFNDDGREDGRCWEWEQDIIQINYSFPILIVQREWISLS